MEGLTTHDWIFMAYFFLFWFILSFIMMILYCMWEERRKYKYYEFTVKDIFFMILFAPFTIVCVLCYVIVWFCMRVLRLEDLFYSLSDFMNKPLKLKKKDKQH